MTIQFCSVFGGFLYGEPCSERNTAYLQKTTPRYPLHENTKCVDITSARNIKFGTKLLKSPLYDTFFQKTAGADTLYADHMNLTQFPIFLVRRLPEIETIDLSGNLIKRVPTKMFKISKKLDKLLVADNKIRIPKKVPLISSRTIKTLMLSNNEIEELYRHTFIMMPRLEVLYLDSNKISSIDSIFNTLPSLKYLHLGNNYLSTIPTKKYVSRSLTHYITKNQKNISDRRVMTRQLLPHRM